MSLTASMFASKYYGIEVKTTDGGIRAVAVEKYRSGDVWKSEWGSKIYWDLTCFLKKKDRYAGHTHSHTYSGGVFRAEDHPSKVIHLEEGELHACFNGKGSPNRFARALQLIDYYLRKAKIKLSSVGWSRMVDLHEFADYYLGLDCNGFIGSYFDAVFPGSTIHPDTHCNDYDNKAKGGVKRFDLSEVRPRDVLVREGGSGTRHVALIDYFYKLDHNSAYIQLVHSSGSRGGLTRSYEHLAWLRDPATNKSQAGSVLSARVSGYMSFNYIIGYPFAS